MKVSELLSAYGIACSIAFSAIPIEAQHSVDQVSPAVVFLIHAEPSGANQIKFEYGTGFLLSYSNTVFLVTAKHVANFIGFSQNDAIKIKTEAGKGQLVTFAALVETNQTEWIHHQKADVSILSLRVVSPLRDFVRQRSLDVTPTLRNWANGPDNSLELTIIGFPLGLGSGLKLNEAMEEGEEFAALTKHTRATGGLMKRGTAFLLEDPTAKGFSGSPVLALKDPIRVGDAYLSSPGPAELLGVVSSVIFDQTGGKFGEVVAIKCVTELIDKYFQSASPQDIAP